MSEERYTVKIAPDTYVKFPPWPDGEPPTSHRATIDVPVAEGGVKCNRNPGICCQPFECLQKGCLA